MSQLETYKESTLTAPVDRNPDKTFLRELKNNAMEDPLTPSETRQAMKTLYRPTKGQDFKHIERRYADTPLPNQLFGLVSFVPAKGATPNKNGVFGFAKLRGNFGTEVEAHQRSVELIKNVDSYHVIHTCYVGRPFPITQVTKFSQEETKVDINKEAQEAFSSSVKNARDKEAQTVKEIKDREKKLLEETKPDYKESDIDRYTTLMVKKAQVSWAYKENAKKVADMKSIVLKTREEIKEMDSVDPTLKDRYMQKYLDARKEAGFEDSKEKTEDNFMRFLVEDIDF